MIFSVSDCQKISSNCGGIKKDKAVLNCGRGEKVILQFVIQVAQSIDHVEFYLEDASGKAVCDTKIFWQWFINVTKPSCAFLSAGKYADPLIPHEVIKKNGLNNVDADKINAILLEFDIPLEGNSRKENYRFGIKGQNESIVIEANIYDVDFSKVNRAKTAFGIFPDRQMIVAKDKQGKYEEYCEIYNLLKDYKISATRFPILQDNVDESFDEIVEKAKLYTADNGIASYSIPYKRVLGMVNDKVYDIEWLEKLLKIMINESSDEFNLFKKAYFYPVEIDEPEPDRYEKVKNVHDDLYNLKRKLALECDFTGKQNVKLCLLALDNLVTVFIKEALYSTVDTCCPTYWGYNMPEFVYETEQLNRLGKKQWWYGCLSPWTPYPTYHLDDKLISSRVEPYMRYFYNIEGNLYWGVNIRRKYYDGDYHDADIYEDPMAYPGANGDGFLMYPAEKFNEKGHFPSIRLASICLGHSDYEYLLDFDAYIEELAQMYEADITARKILTPLFKKLFDGAVVFDDVAALAMAKKEILQNIELAKAKVIVNSYIENSCKMAFVEIYHPSNAKISVVGAKIHEQLLHGDGVKTTFVFDNFENDLYADITISFNGKKFVYKKFVTSHMKNIDISKMESECEILCLNKKSACNYVDCKSFINSDTLKPAIKIDGKFDFSSVAYLNAKIGYQSKFPLMIAIELEDKDNNVYHMGYDILSCEKQEISAHLNPFMQKQLNNIESINAQAHYDELVKEYKKFDFKNVCRIRLILQNFVRLLDDNVETQIHNYRMVIKSLNIEDTGDFILHDTSKFLKKEEII